jgi:uncharacterized OsmC-like protein
MNADELRAIQAPIKQRYRDDPQAAWFTVGAEGQLGEGISCKVDTARGLVDAGLHPVAGGSGLQACSGDMLMEALVACAGVTMRAVAISLGIELREGSKVRAEGDIDSRGTLGIAKDAPVGFQRIRLSFDLETDATPEQLATLVKLTERYCVIFQTLAHPPQLTVAHHVAAA